MYNLENAAKDFPWTAVSWNEVEPWRDEGCNWFEGIPQGWGDVIYKYLCKLDDILKKNDLEKNIIIEQVKEKWGSLRFYYAIAPHFNYDTMDYDEEFTEEQYKAAQDFAAVVSDMERETETVCYNCGTTKDVQCYGGWVHFACPECEKQRVLDWSSDRG